MNTLTRSSNKKMGKAISTAALGVLGLGAVKLLSWLMGDKDVPATYEPSTTCEQERFKWCLENLYSQDGVKTKVTKCIAYAQAYCGGTLIPPEEPFEEIIFTAPTEPGEPWVAEPVGEHDVIIVKGIDGEKDIAIIPPKTTKPKGFIGIFG